jgi:2'-5' RNA ligase
MRLFVGLDIDEQIRERIHQFEQGLSGFAPDVRWVGPETFHVTLKFIGEQPPEMLGKITPALAGVRSAGTQVSFGGYGFFPSPRSARVLWVGIEGDENLVQLAAAVDDSLAGLGMEKENHPFTPHLTLARAGSGAPRRGPADRHLGNKFQRVQERLSKMPRPEFGTMRADAFFLYQSQLSPKGARYTKLERFALE